MLVDETVVEAAQEQQVRHVGPTAAGPPRHVMEVGMATSAARREATLAIAATNGLGDRGGRLTRAAPEAERFAASILEHDLEPRVARQASEHGGADHAVVQARDPWPPSSAFGARSSGAVSASSGAWTTT